MRAMLDDKLDAVEASDQRVKAIRIHLTDSATVAAIGERREICLGNLLRASNFFEEPLLEKDVVLLNEIADQDGFK